MTRNRIWTQIRKGEPIGRHPVVRPVGAARCSSLQLWHTQPSIGYRYARKCSGGPDQVTGELPTDFYFLLFLICLLLDAKQHFEYSFGKGKGSRYNMSGKVITNFAQLEAIRLVEQKASKAQAKYSQGQVPKYSFCWTTLRINTGMRMRNCQTRCWTTC